MVMFDLPEDDRARLEQRFNALIESFSALSKIDTNGVEPLVSVLGINNVLREDLSEKLISRDELLSNAPEQYDGYFQVPGILN